MREFDHEPIRGLPERLPEGESILWQGAPRWWALARAAYHVRAVALYFVALMVLGVASALIDGEGARGAAQSLLVLGVMAALSLGLLCLLAWLSARTSVYTITTRRVVLRIGVAVPKAINIPFKVIASAGLQTRADRSGDIALQLEGEGKIAYMHLWPHVRPWRFSDPQPMLRAIDEPEAVAALLNEAVRNVVDVQDPAPAAPAPPQPAAAPHTGGLAAAPA